MPTPVARPAVRPPACRPDRQRGRGDAPLMASLQAWLPRSSSNGDSLEAYEVRNKHSAVLHDDRMIIFGGHNLREMSFLADLLVYDIKTDSWDRPNCGGAAPCARRAHCAAVLDGHMVVCGGFSGDDCLNDVHALDIATWQWSRLKIEGGQTPCPRGGHSAVVDPEANAVIIYGGWDTTLTYHSDVWEMKCDFGRGVAQWCRINPGSTFVPHGRVGHRAVMHGRQMVIFGGYGGDRYWRDLNTFDLSTHEWAPLTPAAGSSMPSPRTYHALECVGGRLLVIGGSDHSGEMCDVWSFDMHTKLWTEVQCGGLLEGRFAHTSVSHGANVLVFGGIAENARMDAGAHYKEGTDLLVLHAESWAADPSLRHTMLRYAAARPALREALLGLDGGCCGLPVQLRDSLEHYVGLFAAGELPQAQRQPLWSMLGPEPKVDWLYDGPDMDDELAALLRCRGGEVPAVPTDAARPPDGKRLRLKKAYARLLLGFVDACALAAGSGEELLRLAGELPQAPLRRSRQPLPPPPAPPAPASARSHLLSTPRALARESSPPTAAAGAPAAQPGPRQPPAGSPTAAPSGLPVRSGSGSSASSVGYTSRGASPPPLHHLQGLPAQRSASGDSAAGRAGQRVRGRPPGAAGPAPRS
eukprot:TRINITY_DN24335_c0_g1_i1.p1 TRINITY_DN24335_c0_g1~~TRINITY_DN24335_c0_g1_i1.p1  ORF type:complete len:663 (+),score=142.92 TRINITY_DN24335_c0_g1_i1:74-1990(+)